MTPIGDEKGKQRDAAAAQSPGRVAVDRQIPVFRGEDLRLVPGMEKGNRKGDKTDLVMERWGVLIYKSVSDLNITITQSRDINFMGKTTFTGSNFCIVFFARIENFLFIFFVF